MKIVYFDCFAGISGDMALGALVNAGVSIEELKTELSKLPNRDFAITATLRERSMISATKINVAVKPISRKSKPAKNQSKNIHHHSSGERTLDDIFHLIDHSTLAERIKDRAKKIFRTIAVAESHVHCTDIEKIHFHEVGAIDSIVDIVGVAICLEKLQIEEVYSSPIPLGKDSTIKTRHGVMPIPAPATIEILKGYPTRLTNIPFELTTPTGAAIIKTLSKGILEYESIVGQSVGYGAGTADIPDLPNLLRVIIAELKTSLHTDESYCIETNIDDMNPEFYPFVMEKIMNAGAMDVFLVPIIMKKGRPGILLNALVEPGRENPVIETIYRETTTIGLRITKTGRKKLPRVLKVIKTEFGDVQVKIVERDGRKIVVPEFEECRRIAIEKNIPLDTVYRAIQDRSE